MMSNERHVNIIKVALFKVTSDPFTKVANDFKSVCRQQPHCVSDGCLTVWLPWDRSYFSVSRSQLWCICSDLTFWRGAVWTGRGSGRCCPWLSVWPSCDIGCCSCHGGQVVCPQWCAVQTSLPSGEPCGWGRCSFRTRLWYSPKGCSRLCICKSLSGFWVTRHISSASWGWSGAVVWVGEPFQFFCDVYAEELNFPPSPLLSLLCG